jgi:hypothetical protein
VHPKPIPRALVAKKTKKKKKKKGWVKMKVEKYLSEFGYCVLTITFISPAIT